MTFAPPLAVTLAELLTAHEASLPSAATPVVIGEGHLYSRMKVYKNIRDAFFKIGGSFSTTDFCGYTVYPMVALHHLIEKNAIPLINNADVLQDIERSCPGKLHLGDLLRPDIGVKRNYLIHEMSHCLAEKVFPRSPADGSLAAEQKKVLMMMMGEAYANTTATFLALDMKSEIDVALYALNDYGYAIAPHRTDLYLRAAQQFGFLAAFRLVYLLVLANKFLVPGYSEDLVRIAWRIANPEDPVPEKDLKWMTEMGEAMRASQPFLINLTKMYLKIEHFENPVLQVMSFNYFGELYKDSALIDGMTRLARLAETGDFTAISSSEKAA
jgi:hypothetical protein